jgi:hypothetical protein
MAKQELIAIVQKRIESAKYNNRGIAIISLNDLDDGKEILSILDALKGDAMIELNFNLDDMTLQVYSPGDDIDGFADKHPTAKKCSNK